jgi:UDP-N-acetyl-D-galactosamine dehydrogenase
MQRVSMSFRMPTRSSTQLDGAKDIDIEAPALKDVTVAVVGLGYVGLPLALAFGKRRATIGYDLSKAKIQNYKRHNDPTGEVSRDDFVASSRLKFTNDPEQLRNADVVIIAVPTPVDDARLPDFSPLISACRMLGPNIKDGATVVFESTVYPGATEEICIPELESASGKTWKRHFFAGYSPERINPGDKEHSLQRVVKVVAGDTEHTLQLIAALYGSIIPAGVHKATSIRVAEAAKVIENTQRDLNIALMNELAIIFHRMDIDTADVLEAAGTKWNFLTFKPGLVGGHCIGVDPYYLTHAAEKAGHHPQVILAGRRINDRMGKYIAEQTVKCLVKLGKPITGSKVNVLGLSFKEDCADARNSKVVDIVEELKTYGIEVAVHDPRVNRADAKHEYGIDLVEWSELPEADALLVAVAHREFIALGLDALLTKVKPKGCVVDVKSILDARDLAHRGHLLWRL